MASPLSSLLGSSGSSSTNGTSSSSANGGTPAPSEEVFLQLLVSQLQNQDPLNPTDSTQFVSQLAQFSELEQMMQVRSDTDTLVADAGAAAAGSSNTTSNTTPTGQIPAANQTN